MSELVSLGGFKNVRSDFDFEGFKLELDETQFEWGTVYEIEVETVSLHPLLSWKTCHVTCSTKDPVGLTVA